jgi:hypothetical protein
VEELAVVAVAVLEVIENLLVQHRVVIQGLL